MLVMRAELIVLVLRRFFMGRLGGVMVSIVVKCFKGPTANKNMSV